MASSCQHGNERSVSGKARGCVSRKLLSSSSEIQGEHNFFPWLQTFITRKLRGIQTYFVLPLFKIVSKILYHVFIVMLQLHNLLASK
jgi:hypothetical protein